MNNCILYWIGQIENPCYGEFVGNNSPRFCCTLSLVCAIEVDIRNNSTNTKSIFCINV
jgi:hypothetical protein